MKRVSPGIEGLLMAMDLSQDSRNVSVFKPTTVAELLALPRVVGKVKGSNI